MGTKFLSNDIVAVVLINAKKNFFDDDFITISELNQFMYFLQQEFNENELDVVLVSNGLNMEDFKMVGNIIMKSNDCSVSLALLPLNIQMVLSDKRVLAKFFLNLEKERFELINKKFKEINKPIAQNSVAINNGIEKQEELTSDYEQHLFENEGLIPFNEEVDEYNSRDILPAFPKIKCCIPIPPDSGFFANRKK